MQNWKRNRWQVFFAFSFLYYLPLFVCLFLFLFSCFCSCFFSSSFFFFSLSCFYLTLFMRKDWGNEGRGQIDWLTEQDNTPAIACPARIYKKTSTDKITTLERGKTAPVRTHNHLYTTQFTRSERKIHSHKLQSATEWIETWQPQNAHTMIHKFQNTHWEK